MKRIEALESMRFVMIFTIFLSHLYFLKDCDGFVGQFYNIIMTNSFPGVCYFFILSGFGLTYAASKNHEPILLTPIRYAIKRIKKIWPLYVWSMLICVPITVYSAITLHGVGEGMVRTIAKIPLASILVQSATGIAGFSHAFNGVCWFVSALFLLYVIYPYLEKINKLVVSGGRKRIYLTIIITLFLSVMVCVLLSSVENRFTFFDDLTYGTPYYRVFEFFLGCLICDLFLSIKNNPGKINIGTSFEAVVTVVLIVYYLSRNLLPFGRTLLYLLDIVIPAIWIFVFAFEGGAVSKLFQGCIWRKLASASIYFFLLHSVAVGNVVPFLEKLPVSYGWQSFIGVVSISILTIVLIWLFIKLSGREKSIPKNSNL